MNSLRQKDYDVVSLGELVIDLVPITNGSGLAYAAKPGGAPANVAAGVARLGGRAAMIAQVGDDPFGQEALRALQAAGVSTDDVQLSDKHRTPLAVVSYFGEAEASYAFFRENSADINLTLADSARATISASRILHIGTFLLATPVSAHAQRLAVAHARDSGVAVSLDANFRASFWNDTGAMVSAGREMVASATVVKLSHEELELLTGIGDIERAARSLWHGDLALMSVTDGANGSSLFTPEKSMSVPAFSVEVVDTIGCGDAYAATLLSSFLQSDGDVLGEEALLGAALRASAAGAMLATRQGALESMPTLAQLISFLGSQLRADASGDAASSVA